MPILIVYRLYDTEPTFTIIVDLLIMQLTIKTCKQKLFYGKALGQGSYDHTITLGIPFFRIYSYY